MEGQKLFPLLKVTNFLSKMIERNLPDIYKTKKDF